MTTDTSGSRPRVEGSREQEILDAALAEVAEHGYDRLTLDAVASRARASKATLYRRWSSKADLVVEAVGRLKGAAAEDVDTGCLVDDLDAIVCARANVLPPIAVDVMAGLMSAMHRDAELAEAVHRRFITPRTAMARAALARARDRGEIRDDVDLDLLTSAVPALMFYRSMTTGPLDDPETHVRRIVHHVVLPAALHGPVTPDDGA